MKASASTRAWLAKLLILSAVAIVAVLMIGWYTCFRAFVIASGSMESTLVPGDRILVDRISTFLGAPVHRGDIVAYRWPLDRNMRYVHRVVGLPGDRLKIVNKRLYRDGAEVTEPYAQHTSTLLDSYRDNFPNVPNFPLREPAMDMLDRQRRSGSAGGPLLRDGRQSRRCGRQPLFRLHPTQRYCWPANRDLRLKRSEKGLEGPALRRFYPRVTNRKNSAGLATGSAFAVNAVNWCALRGVNSRASCTFCSNC